MDYSTEYKKFALLHFYKREFDDKPISFPRGGTYYGTVTFNDKTGAWERITSSCPDQTRFFVLIGDFTKDSFYRAATMFFDYK